MAEIRRSRKGEGFPIYRVFQRYIACFVIISCRMDTRNSKINAVFREKQVFHPLSALPDNLLQYQTFSLFLAA